MTQVIETDEAGRLLVPDELLRGAGPHQAFAFESSESSDEEYMLRPTSPLPTGASEGGSAAKLSAEEWLKQCGELAEEAGKAWNAEKSAAEVVSEMRR